MLVLITRGEPGGAQVHVRDLVLGLRDRVSFEVGVGDDEFLAQELRAAGVPVHVVPSLQRSVSVGGDVTALRALRALIRSVRPHLVHTHSTKAGLLGRLAARAEGVVAIHTAHAWSFSDGLPLQRKAFAVPVEAAVGRVTRRFLVVSDADRRIALRYHVAREDQLRVVHNGVVDVPGRAVPGAPGEPSVVMVARMAAPKDHALLLRAFAAVKVPGRLVLVGDGPDRPAVEAAVRELGIGGRVRLVGVSNEVARHLAEAQLAALISKQEGFPLVILEAMRAGLPVIASDVGGVREAVEEGVTGTLVARGDEAGLTRALTSLLTSADRRAAMGAEARRVYEERFTVERMLGGVWAAYAELARAEGWPAPAVRAEGGT